MTISYSSSIPNPPDDPADDVYTMQTNSAAISTIIAVDHVGFNVPGGGQHNQVTFNANNVPSTPVSPPVLFTNTPSGLALPELFYYSGDAAHSSNQYVVTSTSTNGSTFLMGGMILKWGYSGTVADGTTISFASAFPNKCFNVQITVEVLAGFPVVGVDKTVTPTTSGFKVRISTGTASFYYIAIGN